MYTSRRIVLLEGFQGYFYTRKRWLIIAFEKRFGLLKKNYNNNSSKKYVRYVISREIELYLPELRNISVQILYWNLKFVPFNRIWKILAEPSWTENQKVSTNLCGVDASNNISNRIFPLQNHRYCE